MPRKLSFMNLSTRLASVLLTGIILTILASVGMHLFQQSASMQKTFIPNPTALDRPPYGAKSMFGLILFITCATMAVCMLYIAAQVSLRLASTDTQSTRYLYALGLYGALGLAFTVVGIVVGATWAVNPLFTCGVVACVGNYTYAPTSPDAPSVIPISIKAVFSMMALFSLSPLGLVILVRTVMLFLRRDRVPKVDGDTSHSVMQQGRWTIPQTTWWFQLLAHVLPTLVALFLFAFVSFYVPNGIGTFTANNIAHRARVRASLTTRDAMHVVPEGPGAIFRTSNVILSDDLVLKLFPGNVFFYAYLALVVCLMWLLRLTPRGRTWLQRPIPLLSGWRGIFWTWGHVLLTTLTVLLVVLFSIYWIHDHNFKQVWTDAAPVGTLLMRHSERWARGLGQVAVLLLSLLAFPASRNSAGFLYSLFGMSWESFLWTHRVLGYGMLLATIAHIVAYLVAYYEDGMLWNNLTKLPTIVFNGTVKSDFTVVVVTWATTILLVAMGIFALGPIRRRCFELFYYSHLLGAYVVFPAVLWHASGSWQYLLPGLTLWLVDRFLRLYRSAAHVDVVSARVVDATTLELSFRWHVPTSAVQPGQFVFINVPVVSLLEWHPFTLSGAPRDGNVYTIHMKRITTVGSWTNALYEHVDRGLSFTMSVDGPCGTPPNMLDYDEVIFVAGGIGITPCATQFQALRQHLVHHQRSGPKRVRLIWSVRSQALIEAMLPTLAVLPFGTNVLKADSLMVEIRRNSSYEDDENEHECCVYYTGPSSLVVKANETTIDESSTEESVEMVDVSSEHKDSFSVIGSEDTDERSGQESVGVSISEQTINNSIVKHFTGRPNLEELLQTSTKAERVLVFVCGPDCQVNATVRIAVNRGMAIHKEEFNL